MSVARMSLDDGQRKLRNGCQDIRTKEAEDDLLVGGLMVALNCGKQNRKRETERGG